GNSNTIRLSTSTGWNAGSTRDPGGDLVTLAVRSWTDTEIVIDGFRGAYGQYGWRLRAGDTLTFQIWNAGTHAGPASFTASIAPIAPPRPAEPVVPPTYKEVRQFVQPETRVAGKVTIEAATIHVLGCSGPAGSGSEVYVYEYAKR